MTIISKLKHSIKNINYKLFLVLIITGFIPTIYNSVRIFFIGQLPNDWGFNVASQLAWVSVIYEVVQEALFLPLFFFIAKELNNEKNMSNKIKTGLICIFIIYFLFSLILIIFAKPLLILMAQNPNLIEQSAAYIRLESIGIVFSMLYKFITVVFISMNKKKLMCIFLFIQMFSTIILDTMLISTLGISLNLGVNGIAYTNIIVNLLLFIVSLFILNKNHIKIFNKRKLDFNWIKEFFSIGGISGLESFIRNFVFLVMILRMVNVIGEQGTFWIANSFIWGWLLLPILQLGELVKRDCAEDKNNIEKNILGYFFITTVMVLLWFVTVPLWKPFIKNVLSISNYEDVFYIISISMWFYIAFAFKNVIDSIFYGRGEIKYVFFSSIITRILFYGFVFVLYILDIYKPTLISVALMFGIGIAFSSILTFFIFRWMLKKENIKILQNE